MIPDPAYPVVLSLCLVEAKPLRYKLETAGYKVYHVSTRADRLYRESKLAGLRVPKHNLIGEFLPHEVDILTIGMDDRGGDSSMAGPVTRPRVAKAARPSIPMDSEVIAPEEADELGIEELEEIELVDGPTVEVTVPEPPKKGRAIKKPVTPPVVEEESPVVEETTEGDVDVLEEVSAEVAAAAAPPKRRTKKDDIPAPAVSVPPSTAGFADLIDVAGAERDWRHRWIIYGFNKTGKTSFADDPQTLIANFEEGTTTIADKPEDQRAMQIPIRTKKKIEELYWFLRSCKVHESGKGLWVPTKVGMRHIDHLVFDTVTRMVYWVLREWTLGEKKADDPTLEIGKVTLPMRGDAYNWVNHWLVLFRDLNLHITFLCQEREPKADEAVGAELGCPDLPPSVRNVVQGDVDVIGHTFVKIDDTTKEAEYRIQFGPNEEYVTGDRFKVLPKVVKHTNFRKLLNFIEKKRAARAAGE